MASAFQNAHMRDPIVLTFSKEAFSFVSRLNLLLLLGLQHSTSRHHLFSSLTPTRTVKNVNCDLMGASAFDFAVQSHGRGEKTSSPEMIATGSLLL